MPAVQYDYDGYDYIVKKRTPTTRSVATTTKSASKASSKGYAPNSNARSRGATTVASRKNTVRATSSSKVNNYATTSKTSSTKRTSTNTVTSKKITSTAKGGSGVVKKTSNAATARTKKTATLEAVKNANRASVRAIMAENGVNTTKKKTATPKRKTASRNLDVPDMLKAKNSKPKEMSLRHADKMIAPKKKAKSVEKKKESVLKTMALSLFAFSILFLICYRSSAINESFNVLGNIKSDLENANTINAQLASDIETQTDISTIETYAKYQLGMQKPKEEQIKKIVINKADKISTPFVVETENESMMSKMWHDIVNILD